MSDNPNQHDEPQTYAAPEPATMQDSSGVGPRVVESEPFAHLPEDLRVPWGWGDLVLLTVVFVFAIFASSILVGAGLTLVAHSRGADPQELIQQANVQALVLALQQMMLFALLFGYLFARIRVFAGRPFWQTIGWRPVPPPGSSQPAAYMLSALAGAVLAIVMQFASLLFKPESPPPIEQFFRTRESIFIMMGLAVVLAPVFEETIFRGFLYPVLVRTLGVPGGILLTGTLFGLMHAVQLWGAWWQLGLLIVVGIVFTTIRARTGSVTPAYFAHLGYNSALFAYLYAATDGFRNLPASQ